MGEVVMPQRHPSDGAVTVRREDGRILLSVEQDGVKQTIELSAFNAWRLFGLLAMFLDVRLPKSVAKAIKL